MNVIHDETPEHRKERQAREAELTERTNEELRARTAGDSIGLILPKIGPQPGMFFRPKPPRAATPAPEPQEAPKRSHRKKVLR